MRYDEKEARNTQPMYRKAPLQDLVWGHHPTPTTRNSSPLSSHRINMCHLFKKNNKFELQNIKEIKGFEFRAHCDGQSSM
jgi:hypothetical protein